jgi:hypothetical protein
MPLLGVVGFVINGSEYPDWTEFPKPPRPTSADAAATTTTPACGALADCPLGARVYPRRPANFSANRAAAVPSVMGDE